MNLRKRFLGAFILSISIVAEVAAQSCAETLNSVQESFNAGHFYGIPAMLKPCLDNGFNRDQRIEAYWLLTRTYLFIDDPISAEDSYLKLLKQDYEYNIDEENDPIEMVYLSRKFTTTPIFMLYAKGGMNLSSAAVIHNYGVDNTAQTQEIYQSGFGFQFGGGAELNINDKISLGLEVNFYDRSYKYRNTLFKSDTQTFNERQSGINLPLFVKYRWDFEKIRPYIYGGFGFSYLFKAETTARLIDRMNAGTEDIIERPVTGPELDITAQRNKFTRFAHAGVGVNYRIGYNYLVLDLRYMAGFSNIVNEQQQYGNAALLYNYGFVDDDKRLNVFAVSIGVVKPLYKPRKIKKTSAKGFLSKIFK